MIIKQKYVQEILLGIYIICYFLVNLYTLPIFPFVHSDESWLSGLTRNMMDAGNFGVTETFFDLKPRYPHGIKIIFHLLQMPMLAIFKYDIFSFRLLSLFFGCICLILFYLLLKFIFIKKDRDCFWGYPLLGTILLSSDIQFIYASHFARQEIVLVLCIILCIYFLFRKNYVMAAAITGISIGIHPNSFLIGTMCAAILLPLGRIEKSKWKPFASYAFITSLFAAFFVSLSLYFDKEFIKHYIKYGNSEFDIGAPMISKLAELPYFIKKIWYGVSGTYYVPNIKVELLLFLMVLLVAIVYIFIGKEKNRAEVILVLKGLAGLLIGMILIGRYNQTSIIFLFPLLFILILLTVDFGFEYLTLRNGMWKNITILILTISLALSSMISIIPWKSYSYDDYIDEIASVILPSNKVLANLNCEYYFENGKLLDYRNLSFLKEEKLSIEDYIRENDIEYIILSDELNFIYSQRPVWNMIYGNLRYLDELHDFTDKNCILVHSFQNNTYGTRIVQHMNSDRDFTIQIFKVKDFT